MISYEKKRLKKFDYFLFFIISLLTIYGFFSIYIATGGTSYFKSQGAAFILGIIAILVLSFIDYDIFGKLYLPIYIFSNILLLAVLISGIGSSEWGASSWLVIGGISFQPSEIVKVGIIISLAKFIENNSDNINEFLTLIKILVFAFVPIGLVVLQNDLGTALVFMFFTFIMLFVAGLDIKYILYSGLLGIISIPIAWFGFFEDYQKKRLLVFLDPSLDPMGSGWNVTQAKTAIGSGQIIGRFITGNADFATTGWLPEKHTDFIFAVIGESFGLIGGALLILLYTLLIYRLIYIAKNAKDLFGSLVVVGITSMISFHIIENIGMTMGLMPVTGIPLPFISYGGTFMLTNMIALGLVFSIAIKRSKINF